MEFLYVLTIPLVPYIVLDEGRAGGIDVDK